MAPNPRIEAMLMIDPPRPVATMRRAASCPTRTTPSRLTAMTARHSSSLMRVKYAFEGMPALLTRMQIGPNAASVCSTPSATDARSVTSMATAAASPPSALISAASRCNASMLRAANATLAPAPASTRAKWRPKPDEAPVTRATLPASESRSLPSIVALLLSAGRNRSCQPISQDAGAFLRAQHGLADGRVKEEIGARRCGKRAHAGWARDAADLAFAARDLPMNVPAKNARELAEELTWAQQVKRGLAHATPWPCRGGDGGLRYCGGGALATRHPHEPLP